MIEAKAKSCYEKWCNDREEQRRLLKLKDKKDAKEKVIRVTILHVCTCVLLLTMVFVKSILSGVGVICNFVCY